IYAIEAVLPQMLQRRRGHLAAVSSLAAYKGLPGKSAYCASKAAVNTYLEGLRIHLRDRGIAVTTLCPGFVRTPMTATNAFQMPGLLEAGAARPAAACLAKPRVPRGRRGPRPGGEGAGRRSHDRSRPPGGRAEPGCPAGTQTRSPECCPELRVRKGDRTLVIQESCPLFGQPDCLRLLRKWRVLVVLLH